MPAKYNESKIFKAMLPTVTNNTVDPAFHSSQKKEKITEGNQAIPQVCSKPRMLQGCY